MPPEPLAELRAGVLAVIPAAIAVVPFGLLFGALAAEKGLSALEVTLMSTLVFAGAAQLVVIGLWADPVPWLLLTATTLMVNSRHVLMGAALAPKMRGFGTGKSLVSLFLLADEVWALAEARAGARALRFPFMLGVGGTLWLNWICASGIGAGLGRLVADPEAFGFDFAFTAIFVGLLVGLWRGRSTGLAIAVSAATAAAVHLAVPGPWYIAAGGIAGALACGLVGPAERRRHA